jgi:hypothetical protein
MLRGREVRHCAASPPNAATFGTRQLIASWYGESGIEVGS